MTAVGWREETTKSMSPMVSRQRRRLPAGLQRMTSGWSRSVREWVRRPRGLREEVPGGVLPAVGDALQDPGLALFSEALERGDLAGAASGFELDDGLESQVVVQGLDFLRGQPGEVEQLEEAGWDGGFELIVVGEPAGGDEEGDLLLQRFADALEFRQAVFGDEGLERFGQAFERAGGRRIGPGLEGVLARELEEDADLRLEQFRLSGAWGRRGIQDTDAPRHGPTASRTGQHRLGPDRFHEVESDLEEILETRLTDAVTDSGTPPAHGATTPGTQDFHALDPACRGQAAAAGPAFHRVTG
jgi:hypothetical protein